MQVCSNVNKDLIVSFVGVFGVTTAFRYISMGPYFLHMAKFNIYCV